jgi:hypothetical protein
MIIFVHSNLQKRLTMKPIITLVAIVISSISCYCQNIGVEQLANLRNKPIKDINEYLTSHRWKLINNQTDPNRKSEYSYTYAYGTAANSNAATAFFAVICRGSERVLQLRLFDVATYNACKSRLLSLGYRRVRSLEDQILASSTLDGSHDDNLCDYYKSNGVFFRLCTDVQYEKNVATTVYIVRVNSSQP